MGPFFLNPQLTLKTNQPSHTIIIHPSIHHTLHGGVFSHATRSLLACPAGERDRDTYTDTDTDREREKERKKDMLTSSKAKFGP